jgi:hypothetical protein
VEDAVAVDERAALLGVEDLLQQLEQRLRAVGAERDARDRRRRAELAERRIGEPERVEQQPDAPASS